MNRNQNVIDEKTRFNLRFDNLYAIVACVIMIVGVFALFDKRLSMMEQKQEQILQGQKELTMEFRDWKKQAEERLGIVESRQNTVISWVENHLQVKLK